MGIGRKQIGWSNESNLLWQISSQLERLIQVTAALTTSTTTTVAPTTTTTTTTGGASSYTITTVGDKSPSCTVFGSTQTVYAASSNINSIVTFFTNPSLTTPFVGDTQYFVYTNGVSVASAQVEFDGSVLNAVPC
jgi:hypothetical protein